MLRASLRLIERHEAPAEGESVEAIHADLAAKCPPGFELVEALMKMGKTGGMITTTGIYMRRDQTQQIEAATLPELEALVPEGWQILHVIRVDA